MRADGGVVLEEPPADIGKPPTHHRGPDDEVRATQRFPTTVLRAHLGLNVTSGDQYLELSWRRLDGETVRFGWLYASGKLDTAYITRTAERYGNAKVGVEYLEAVCGRFRTRT